MTIELLRLENFRNVTFSELEFSPGLNIIHGENAAGKTSFIEAIHFLARAKSFRTNKTQQLINKKANSFTLFSEVSTLNNIQIPLGVGYLNKKIIAKLDNQNVTRLSEIARFLPIQTLSGNLHQIIEQGPSFRRQFIDWALFHVKHSYMNDWQCYRKSLLQRNAGLRNGASDVELSYWEIELVKYGQSLTNQRQEYLNVIQGTFQRILFSLLVDDIKCILEYKPGLPKDQTHEEILIKERKNDREKGFTFFGPHRADIIFKGSDGANIFPLLSRGQQKLLVISLQLAHIHYTSQQLDEKPHFLLDDLGAELDINHQNKVLSEIYKTGVQAFITTLDPTNYQLLSDNTRMFHVKHGQINKVL